jgi:uncharacterized protein YggE
MSDNEKVSTSPKTKREKKLVLTLSWKLLSIILIVVLVALTIYTKPWEMNSSNPRTLEITGEATIKRAPDSFVFNPTYEAETQEAITLKTNEVVKDLKELGLGDAGIQTQVSNYENYGMTGPDGTFKYSVYMTLAVEDKELAQKVQDYLVVSGAIGQVTPNNGFKSDTKKALRDEALTLAVEDAKKRAEQTANNLGVKVVKVIKIDEVAESYDVFPIASYDSTAIKEGSSLPINTGESEYPFSVKVVFEIR